MSDNARHRDELRMYRLRCMYAFSYLSFLVIVREQFPPTVLICLYAKHSMIFLFLITWTVSLLRNVLSFIYFVSYYQYFAHKIN